MKIINLGILAHVDAGKTTLTESLLYTSGAIAELGSVDKGTTRTDTMNLERQRGITIQTAVTSFQWDIGFCKGWRAGTDSYIVSCITDNEDSNNLFYQ